MARINFNKAQMRLWLSLKIVTPRHLSKPCQREYMAGARQAVYNGDIRYNPWRSSRNGRDYIRFERMWDAGFKDAQDRLAEVSQAAFDKVSAS